jgi:hypothetical protein
MNKLFLTFPLVLCALAADMGCAAEVPDSGAQEAPKENVGEANEALAATGKLVSCEHGCNAGHAGCMIGCNGLSACQDECYDGYFDCYATCAQLYDS